MTTRSGKVPGDGHCEPTAREVRGFQDKRHARHKAMGHTCDVDLVGLAPAGECPKCDKIHALIDPPAPKPRPRQGREAR